MDIAEGMNVVVHRNNGPPGRYYWEGTTEELPLFSQGTVISVESDNKVIVELAGTHTPFHPSEIVDSLKLEQLLESKDRLMKGMPAPFLVESSQQHSVVILEDRVFYLAPNSGSGTSSPYTEPALFFCGRAHQLIEMESLLKLELLYKKVFGKQIRELESVLLKDPDYASKHVDIVSLYGEMRLLHTILTETLPHFAVVSEEVLQQDVPDAPDEVRRKANIEIPGHASVLSQVLRASSAFISGSRIYELKEVQDTATQATNFYAARNGRFFVPETVRVASNVFRAYRHALLSGMEYDLFDDEGVAMTLGQKKQRLLDDIQEALRGQDAFRFTKDEQGYIASLDIQHQYALRDPGDGQHYLFMPASIAIGVWGEGTGKFSFSHPKASKSYSHPFVSGGDICLDGYAPPEDLSAGHKIAAYLITAKQVFLSGYMKGVHPYSQLNSGRFPTIGTDELVEKNIPVTNVHYAGKR